MGLFKAEVQVRNPAGGAFVEISPVVDTGAVYSMLPESLLCQELGLAPRGIHASGWDETDAGLARLVSGLRESMGRVTPADLSRKR